MMCSELEYEGSCAIDGKLLDIMNISKFRISENEVGKFEPILVQSDEQDTVIRIKDNFPNQTASLSFHY